MDGATVHPRVVVRRALMHNAAALVVAHGHPSGVAEPSIADRAITKRLAEALALVDIRLIDHFVVGDGETVSFANAVCCERTDPGTPRGLFAARRPVPPSVSVHRARAVRSAGRTPGRGEGEGLPSRCRTRQPAQETVPCSISTLTCNPASDLLAQLGLDGRAIRTILEEPAPFDPRGDEAE